MDLPRKLFFKIWPSQPKRAITAESKSMRRMLLICLLVHILYFLVSLAYLGFKPMLADLGYSLFVYSVYLTLYRPMIMLYMVVLFAGIGLGLWYIYPFDQYSESTILYISNLVLYGFMLYFTFLKYRAYTKAGRGGTKDDDPAMQTKKAQIKKKLIEGKKEGEEESATTKDGEP